MFDNWLAAQKSAGRGGFAFPPIDRGLPYNETFSVTGDVSSDSFKAEVRASPDAGGAALAAFTVTPGAYSDSSTLLTFSLTESEFATITDDDGDGVAECVMDVIHFPLGGTEYRMLACSISLLGAVTDDDA